MRFTRAVLPPLPGKTQLSPGIASTSRIQRLRRLPVPAGAPPAPAGQPSPSEKAPLAQDNRRPGVKKTVEIPKIPLDIASHKLYYVNLEMSPTNAPWPSPPMNLY